MPLKQNPDPVGHAGILAAEQLDPARGWLRDAGSTSPPAGAEAPDYEIVCAPEGDHFQGRLTIRRHASSGTNTAVYLQAGVYETNASLDLVTLEDHRKKGMMAGIGNYMVEFGGHSQNRVHLYMSPEMAELSRRAELEHCDDLVYAYQQTLETLELALVSVSSAGPVTGATSDQARAKVAAAIRAAIPPQRAGLGIDPPAWLAEYERLCAKTRERDDNGWHFFDLERVEAAKVPGRDRPTYLTGARRDRADFPICYLRYIAGNTEIGTHSTAGVIV
ncbi:hypothetical protein [Actinomadura opuntiae]|uniref:hypothetical protein n=1 Tax=Actinomadura sp. OS1-43 TaxID=604315 RepID=UPI00255B3FDC|nr:hypothetical protein [Actinomadura sp. OS1-43]MDL4817657.1 hypothetical protein [Actinomadura sp. OS1-43]